MTQRPVAIGLLVCEQIVIEEKTRNVTLVNGFTHRMVEQFPSEPFPFVVYAILTDGMGDIAVEARITRLDNLEVVYRRFGSFRFTDPLKEIPCVVRIRDCSFPVSGYYDIVLLTNDEMVAQRRLLITEKENPI